MNSETSLPTQKQKIWSILETVVDPEVPVLTIIDLGIVREVKINGDEIEIIITPTSVEKNYWRDHWRFRELFYILSWRDLKVRKYYFTPNP